MIQLDLNPDRVNSVNLSSLSNYLANEEYRGYFLKEKGENYKLIYHIVSQFNGELLFDIGTNRGSSSIAMSSNPNNRVISYDIVNILQLNHRPNNVEYRIDDFTKDQYVKEVLSSPFIMLDTDHDGPFEYKTYNHLNNIGWKGYLLLDDIYLNEEMKGFWNHIDRPKMDLTDIAHWSGTGLVVFQ